MSQHIKNLIPSCMLRESAWQKALLAAWPSIMGPLHEHAVIEKIVPPLLVIGVTNSCLLQELHLLSPVLLKKIQETVAADSLKQIRLQLKAMPRRNTPRVLTTPMVHMPQKKLTQEATMLPMLHKNALMNIKDQSLRDALLSFWLHCFRE